MRELEAVWYDDRHDKIIYEYNVHETVCTIHPPPLVLKHRCQAPLQITIQRRKHHAFSPLTNIYHRYSILPIRPYYRILEHPSSLIHTHEV